MREGTHKTYTPHHTTYRTFQINFIYTNNIRRFQCMSLLCKGSAQWLVRPLHCWLVVQKFCWCWRLRARATIHKNRLVCLTKKNVVVRIVFVFFSSSSSFLRLLFARSFYGIGLSNFNVLIITCHILMPIKRESFGLSFIDTKWNKWVWARLTWSLFAWAASPQNNTFNSNFQF